MERIYLHVPPEEYAEVKASGACWDDATKRWYTGGESVSATLVRWTAEEADSSEEAEFGLTSEEAAVASAQVPCAACGQRIEVICIDCTSGIDTELGEALTQFTVSQVSAMDDALAAQLERWPCFNRGAGADSGEGSANHCPHCGRQQEDYLLHAEPGDVFFCIPEAEPGSITFTPLAGRIRVSGDLSFGI